MTCPLCGGDTKVKDSVADAEGVYRQRKCKECAFIFYTEETDAEQTKFFDAKNTFYRNRYHERKMKKKQQGG